MASNTVKLSIIIPYYNLQRYTDELLDCLAPQITDDVEVIVIDDGSKVPFKTDHDFVKVIRQRNQGVSAARNNGIENSIGEYIQFIDADDMVAENFVSSILSKMPFDYLDMSWKSFGGKMWSRKLNSEYDKLDNPSACTRTFSREFIGDVRFNKNKDTAEDEEFVRKLGLSRGKRAVITDYMYFYRTSVEGSKTTQYTEGKTKTKRIVYYFDTVPNDKQLLKEIREEDKKNEVVVLANNCLMPELSMYARIQAPHVITGNELRGEYTPLFNLIETAFTPQVILYKSILHDMCGIETFMYNFCLNMKEYYDIAVVYDNAEIRQLNRLRKLVRCYKNTSREITCDTLIVNSIHDTVPKNIKAKNVVQMIHACNSGKPVPIDKKLVFVSDVAKSTYNLKGSVIPNMTDNTETEKALLFVSTTRISDAKGSKRMVNLANILNRHEIPYIWLYFSNDAIKNAPDNLIRVSPKMDIKRYLAMADYLVQLSDNEAFCYSIVEALQLGIPVITTPINVLPEIGFEDGVNGYVVPFDFDDLDVEEFMERRLHGFTYRYDNAAAVKAWRKLLGNTKPKKDYVFDDTSVRVEVLADYRDMYFDTYLTKGMVLSMPKTRADQLSLSRKVKKI